MLSFARVKYTTGNLGDDIQMLATLPFLGSNPTPFDRDTLALQESKEKLLLIMNGWWAANPELAFPPAECFLPVFIGFHISERHSGYFTSSKCIEYFKKYQPIGCRDLFTMDLLEKEGIECFFSGCLSTTFDKLENIPFLKKVYLVDTERVDHLIPKALKENALRLTHHFKGNQEDRDSAVEMLMEHYRKRPALVITTRLHAALPCSAMGIPVVFFFHPDDPRTSTATQIGLKMYKPFLRIPSLIKKILVKTNSTRFWIFYEKIIMWIRYRFFVHIDWSPEAIEFEAHKKRLKQQTINKIRQVSNQ